MLTSDQLHAIMPNLSAARSAALFPFLSAALKEFAIDRPARTAAFVAQLAHESGQFRFMEELWGPTPAQQRYEPPSELAARLGNTEPGDGLRFKGRGPIQITGRANYRQFGQLLGMDLLQDPPTAARPEVAFRVAALFWSKKGLNELADEANADAFREITRRINGGFNGLAERQRFYDVARTVLGVTGPPVTRGGPPATDRARAPEPAFDRGWEAIEADRPERPRRRRTAASKKVARKTKRKATRRKTARRRVSKKRTRKTKKAR
jgi:predicted chitinase